MHNKCKKNRGILIFVGVLIVYFIFMAGTGRMMDTSNATEIVNMDEESEYAIGRISNDREYSIVINKKVANLNNVTLKIKDLKEKYIEDYRNNGIISIKFYNNETGKYIGEKELSVQDILLRTHYAKESSDSSVEYTGVSCGDLDICANSVKIIIKGKNINQDSELVIYGNRENKIENMESYDDGNLISGNILCNITQGQKKVSTDFVWGFILMIFIGVSIEIVIMNAKKDGGINGKEDNK